MRHTLWIQCCVGVFTALLVALSSWIFQDLKAGEAKMAVEMKATPAAQYQAPIYVSPSVVVIDPATQSSNPYTIVVVPPR